MVKALISYLCLEKQLEEPDTLSFDNYSKRVCGAKGALFYSNCRIEHETCAVVVLIYTINWN